MSLIFNPHMKPRLGTPINKAMAHKLGLIGCWLFNEAGGGQAFDLSGNGNTGTLQGDTHIVPGKFGSALDFDGTGDYAVVGSAKFDNVSAGTYSFWVYNRGTSYYFLSSSGITNPLIYSSTVRCSIYTSQGEGYRVYGDTGGIPANVWIHYAFTYDAVSAKAYKNGVCVDENLTPTYPLDSATSDFYIATDRTIGQRFLNGLMDHVMIFNRALSANEIQQLYREPFCMFQRELIELWAASGGAPPAGHPYYYREFANRRIA